MDTATLIDNALHAAGMPNFDAFFTGAGELGEQLATVVKLIWATNNGVAGYGGLKRQVFFVTTGGYDTHGDQLAAQGVPCWASCPRHWTGFYNALNSVVLASRATAFTASGLRSIAVQQRRRHRPRLASHHFVVGGAVQGGKFYGDNLAHTGLAQMPSLAPSASNPNDGGYGQMIPPRRWSSTRPRWRSGSALSTSDINLILPNLANFTTKTFGFCLAGVVPVGARPAAASRPQSTPKDCSTTGVGSCTTMLPAADAGARGTVRLAVVAHRAGCGEGQREGPDGAAGRAIAAAAVAVAAARAAEGIVVSLDVVQAALVGEAHAVAGDDGEGGGREAQAGADVDGVRGRRRRQADGEEDQAGRGSCHGDSIGAGRTLRKARQRRKVCAGRRPRPASGHVRGAGTSRRCSDAHARPAGPRVRSRRQEQGQRARAWGDVVAAGGQVQAQRAAVILAPVVIEGYSTEDSTRVVVAEAVAVAA